MNITKFVQDRTKRPRAYKFNYLLRVLQTNAGLLQLSLKQVCFGIKILSTDRNNDDTHFSKDLMSPELNISGLSHTHLCLLEVPGSILVFHKLNRPKNANHKI